MNLKYFILILLISYVKLYENNEESIELIRTYYDCIRNQELSISNSAYRRAITCRLNEKCILESKYCNNPIQYSKTVWFKLDEKINKTKIINSNLIDKYNNLIINQANLNDNGSYFEKIYNQTIINEYHLTIVTDNYYPVYENDLKFSDEFKKNEINYKIEWNEWSECKCDQNGTNGYRTRFGQCFSISKLDIFKYYNHVIPCQSKLLLDRNYSNPDYIMFGDCNNLNCTKIKIENIQNLANNFKEIYVDYSDDTLLDCFILKNNYDLFSNLNVKWNCSNNNSKSLLIDPYYRLNLKSISYSDIGEYYCYVNNEIRLTYSLNLIVGIKTKNKIYTYTTNAGCCFLLITLILVNFLVCLQRKTIKKKFK
jgi:hypothetical protein